MLLTTQVLGFYKLLVNSRKKYDIVQYKTTAKKIR